MKNKKIGIIALVIFMIVIVSQNIMLMNKTNKLLGTVPSRNIGSNEVEYTSEKTVQGAINDLAEKANIIGTDEEKNKFRDDSKTLIGQIGTDKLNTTSQNLTGAINELKSYKDEDSKYDRGYAECTDNAYCPDKAIVWYRYGKIVIVTFTNIYPTVDASSSKVLFATGLPSANSTTYGMAISMGSSSTTSDSAYRIIIENNTGELKWHFTYSGSKPASGFIVYIAK